MKIISALAMSLTISGCAYMTTYQKDIGPDITSQSVDVKQRFLLVNSKNLSIPRICAEPSPDAMSAAVATFGASATKPDMGSAAQLSAALADSSAYVGLRTQSIQLMRDSMYRACEGYMSGAIDGPTFAGLQRRFQAQVIALLSIEQLTGTVATKPVVLNTNANSSVGGTTESAAARATDAANYLAQKEDDKDKAEESLALADKKLNDALNSKKDGPELIEKAKQEKQLAEKELKRLTASVADAKDLKDAAYQDLRSAKGRVQSGVGTSAQGSFDLLHTMPPSADAIGVVADRVHKIIQTVMDAHEHDDIQVCYERLSSFDFYGVNNKNKDESVTVDSFRSLKLKMLLEHCRYLLVAEMGRRNNGEMPQADNYPRKSLSDEEVEEKKKTGKGDKGSLGGNSGKSGDKTHKYDGSSKESIPSKNIVTTDEMEKKVKASELLQNQIDAIDSIKTELNKVQGGAKQDGAKQGGAKQDGAKQDGATQDGGN